MSSTEVVPALAEPSTADDLSHFYCGADDCGLCGASGVPSGIPVPRVDCVVCMDLDRTYGRLTCPRTGQPCWCSV